MPKAVAVSYPYVPIHWGLYSVAGCSRIPGDYVISPFYFRGYYLGSLNKEALSLHSVSLVLEIMQLATKMPFGELK